MNNSLTFQWIFVTWVITFIIHYHTIKRGVISEKKDKIIELLSTLSDLKWLEVDQDYLYLEDKFNSLVSRIEWNLKHINSVSACTLLHLNELDGIRDFDVESYLSADQTTRVKKNLQFSLQDNCTNLIDLIESRYFDKVLNSKWVIFRTAKLMWLLLTLLVVVICVAA